MPSLAVASRRRSKAQASAAPTGRRFAPAAGANRSSAVAPAPLVRRVGLQCQRVHAALAQIPERRVDGAMPIDGTEALELRAHDHGVEVPALERARVAAVAGALVVHLDV